MYTGSLFSSFKQAETSVSKHQPSAIPMSPLTAPYNRKSNCTTPTRCAPVRCHASFRLPTLNTVRFLCSS